MKNIKKFLSTVLCIVIVIGCFVSIPISAATYPIMGEISSSTGSTSIYSLPGTTGHETEENKNQSRVLCTLTNGTQIKALGVEKDGDGDPWYRINYGENFENVGYAFVTRVSLKYVYEFDEDFENNLLKFPESYHDALRELHAKYPNWKFVANSFDLTFNDLVEAQYGVYDVSATRKWVEFDYGGNEWRDMRAYNSDTNQWITLEGRWTYASRQAIEYFIDPRNSLTENKIFAFMQQSYQEDTNVQENLQALIKGTFLENGYDKNNDGTLDKNAYVEDIIEAAVQSRVSPYVLAATIIVEQGVGGTSDLISGTYNGYVGYYNFFNFSAYGSTVQQITASGLEFAKSNSWNSRSAAIIGGAKMYADGYINIGQDTYYYKNFNVINEYWSHQYATALYDAWTNASYLKKGCINNADASLVFSIPIYKDMPETVPTVNHTHTYDSDCDADCNTCREIRVVAGHLYKNACDTICGLCGNVRNTPPHTHAKCYEGYDVQLYGSWEIIVENTGVYNLKPDSQYTGEFNLHNIVVFNRNGKEVKYYEKYGGWPLVKDLQYTVKFRYNCEEETEGTIIWSDSIITDTIFADTVSEENGGWYNNAVTYAVGAGLITGYGGTDLFGAADNIQRQDFVVILARLAGVDLQNYQSNRASFTDVPSGEYYEKAIMWAADCGITTGYADGSGKFGVGDNITREQLVTFLYRYAKYQNGGVAPEVDNNAADSAAAYPDFVGVTDYAKEAIIWALDKGVISGQGGTHIAPGGNAKRCEVAKIIYNIFLNNIF